MSVTNLRKDRLENQNHRKSPRRLLRFWQRRDTPDEPNGEGQEAVLPFLPVMEEVEAQPPLPVATEPVVENGLTEAEQMRAALVETQARLVERERQLAERTTQVEALTGELQSVRARLAAHEATLAEQQRVADEQQVALLNWQQANDSLDSELRMAQARIEQAEADRHNLQAALTASIQHAAEQQDSLLRWQELAESADECVAGLEKQVTVLQSALHHCSNEREGLHQEMEEMADALQKARAQLNILNHHQKTVVHLAEARQQIVELEQALEQGTGELLHYKTSLANNQAMLQQVELRLEEHSALLAMTRKELTARDETVNRSQAVFARLVTLLRQKATQESRLRGQLNQLAGQVRGERTIWYKTLKRNEQQLATTQAELDRFWQGYRAQGQRMAEVQTSLLQCEQALAETKARLKQQGRLLSHMRHAADGRISTLEAELNQARQQIHDLQLVVERRNKREVVESGE
jgi:chromosome segregation ATPase